MKDNFDLKSFLVENKMTEASRGQARKHFEKIELNKHVLLEMNGADAYEQFEKWYPNHVDEFASEDEAYTYFEENVLGQMDECDAMPDLEEAAINKDSLRRELMHYETKYGMQKGRRIFLHFHPEVKDIDTIIPRFEKKNTEIANKQDQARLNRVSLGAERAADNLLMNPETGKMFKGPDRLSKDEPVYDKQGYRIGNTVVDEASYTYDDDDDDYVDDTFIGAHGDDGIATDKRAERAARAGIKGTDLDDTATDDTPEFPDMEPDAADDDAFEDPEDMAADTQPKATKGSVDMAKVFGKNAPYVEVLIDDLPTYLKGPRGNWRVSVSTNVLRRAVDAAKQYLDDFEYPKKGILYLQPNKMGMYDQDIRDKGNAVVAVHRDPVE